MIKNIIFDLGGVIISLDRERCLNSFTQEVGVENFGDYLNSYAQIGFFAEFEDGKITAKEFRDHIRSISKKSDISDQAIDISLCAFLTEIAPEKGELLLSLKEKYNLYLLSNTNPIAWECAQKIFLERVGVPIEQVFNKLYLSYEMKCSKPEKEIYNRLLEDSGVEPAQTLFIDDAVANIATGEQFGIKTLLYNVEDSLCEKVKEALENNG